MKLKLFGTLLAALAAAGGFTSCDNMDALYTQYLQEQNYSGKISNLQGQSGTGRVILTWTNPEDQISKKIKIVYGDDKQERVYDTLVDEASIDGLTASAYEFTVYTMDAYDNLSVPVSISKTLYTQSHINSMEAPRCSLTKVVAAATDDEDTDGGEGTDDGGQGDSAEESYTYTLTFAGLCNSLMMFGGELEYTIRDTEGTYTHSDTYSVTIAANSLSSSYISKSFEGLELIEGHAYEIEYSLQVYPANLASVGTNGSYSYTGKSIDLTTITKTVTIVI